jgi:hypothetical protein
MSAFAAIYAPAGAVFGTLAATLAATLGMQWLLRDRYERQRIVPPAVAMDPVGAAAHPYRRGRR